MKIDVIGGGPAGLYLSWLMKRDDPSREIRVFEQNPPDATFGFGVVFSDRALDFLKADDTDTYDFLTPRMETWPDIRVVHRDQAIDIDGNGFAAIGRLELLTLLRTRCQDAGIRIDFKKRVNSPDELPDADLLIGADGVNSVVREARRADFRPETGELDNRFIWYGTTKRFDCLTLTFRETPDGVFCAHHYRYSPEMSTFIVECDAATWDRAGFAGMPPDQTMAYCEKVFAPDLGGHPLVANNSSWRRFPAIANGGWSAGNAVLLGDALHTAHFSIGSGTRLAMEDAIALAGAFRDCPGDVPGALARYEAVRRPVVEKIVGAANVSAGWYENMAETMRLPPWEFARSYMTRTGRVGDDRLRQIAPRFMAGYLAAQDLDQPGGGG